MLTWRELNLAANFRARALQARGLGPAGVTMIGLPSGLEHVITTMAAWKLGAVVVPVDPILRATELDHLISVVSPVLYVGNPGQELAVATVTTSELAPGSEETNPPAAAEPPRSAACTGGTQGRVRVIFRKRGWWFAEDGAPSAHERAMGLTRFQVHLVVVPQFHGGFGALYGALGLGHRVVLLSRFVPAEVADAIERYAVNSIRLVPSMMKLLLLPGGVVGRDLSSLQTINHGTAPCPPDVKRAWLELIGPEKVFEGYSSQEQFAYIHIRGDEWLAHPGSVGRPVLGSVVIIDDDDSEVAAGEVGRIFFYSPDGAGPDYVGAGEQLPCWRESYFTVGDFGYLDQQGYLYVQGRATDLINVGGVSVYPAEVEGTLLASPDVADACVLPRPHPSLGQVPHAMVVAAVPHLSVDALDSYCRSRLSLHKVPFSYQLVDALPRDAAGKLRRSAVERIVV